MRRLTAYHLVMLSVLASIWLYNRFSGRNIADLGKKA